MFVELKIERYGLKRSFNLLHIVSVDQNRDGSDADTCYLDLGAGGTQRIHEPYDTVLEKCNAAARSHGD